MNHIPAPASPRQRAVSHAGRLIIEIHSGRPHVRRRVAEVQRRLGFMVVRITHRLVPLTRWALRRRPETGTPPRGAAVVVPLLPRCKHAAASQDALRAPDAFTPAAEAQRYPIAAPEAASAFLAWLREHGLAREWAVDDVWFLAEADFAEAADLALPPRRVFLGALQKLEGVGVVYDRRTVRDGKRVKTTFYSFEAEPIEAAPVPMRLAA